MTPEQLHQIEQARRYAEQDEYVVTRTHIRNLLEIIEGQAASVPDGWKLVPELPTIEMENAWHEKLLSCPTFWAAWGAAANVAPEAPEA